MNSTAALREHLHRSHGLTRGASAVRLWSRFAEASVQAVLAACDEVRSTADARFTHKDGWWRSATRTSAGAAVRLPAEDALTDAILDVLEEIRARAAPGDPLYEMNIVFAGQVPRRQQRRIGPKALTTDLRVYSPGVRNLDMRIEAKVVFSTSDVTGAYMGESGLGRFTDEHEPYADGMVGAMLGYVLRPRRGSWTALLGTSLGRRSPPLTGSEVTIGGRAATHLASDVACGMRQVTVLHLLVPFDTDPVSWKVGSASGQRAI